MKHFSIVIVFLLFPTIIFSATGWYDDYIIINPDNSGSSYYWIGSDPSYGTELNNNNFGTVSSLEITGCDLKYWDDTQNRTGGAFYYKIMSSDGNTTIISTVETIWDQSGPSGNDYQGTKTVSINLLNGLDPNTSYQLHVWAKSWGGEDSWLTNSGNNYVATFTTQKNTYTGTGNWSDSGNWSFGTPVSTEDVIISGDLTLTSNITIGDITIDNTFSITINPLIQLTTGAITNNSNSSGVTLKSDNTGNGSLIFSGSGPEAVVWRYIQGYTPSSGDGWHLISSPVDSYSIGSSDFEPGATDDFYAFDEPTYTWLNQKVGANSITSFENGKGYLVAYESTGDPKNFFGTLNSADITFTDLSVGDGDGWHLLGNPFSSALIWNENSGWIGSDFVATAKVRSESGGNYLDIATDEYIPSTNGFFVQATNGTNSITIKEGSRTHNTADNYKSSSSNLMHLIITNDVNSFYDKNRIGINSVATEAFDLAFDSHKLYGNSSAPQLATKIGDEIFSINYLPELISNYDLSLEFKAGVDANYRLLFEGINSFDEDIYITLEDLKTQVFTNLNDVQEYNFTGDSSDEPDRFIIHFFKSGLGIGDLEKSNLSVYAHNSYVMVQNQTNSAGSIQIFDLSGKKIFDHTLSNQELSSYRINAPSGAYIIYVRAGESTIRETIIIAKN